MVGSTWRRRDDLDVEALELEGGPHNVVLLMKDPGALTLERAKGWLAKLAPCAHCGTPYGIQRGYSEEDPTGFGCEGSHQRAGSLVSPPEDIAENAVLQPNSAPWRHVISGYASCALASFSAYLDAVTTRSKDYRAPGFLLVYDQLRQHRALVPVTSCSFAAVDGYSADERLAINHVGTQAADHICLSTLRLYSAADLAPVSRIIWALGKVPWAERWPSRRVVRFKDLPQGSLSGKVVRDTPFDPEAPRLGMP